MCVCVFLWHIIHVSFDNHNDVNFNSNNYNKINNLPNFFSLFFHELLCFFFHWSCFFVHFIHTHTRPSILLFVFLSNNKYFLNCYELIQNFQLSVNVLVSFANIICYLRLLFCVVCGTFLQDYSVGESLHLFFVFFRILPSLLYTRWDYSNATYLYLFIYIYRFLLINSVCDLFFCRLKLLLVCRLLLIPSQNSNILPIVIYWLFLFSFVAIGVCVLCV